MAKKSLCVSCSQRVGKRACRHFEEKSICTECCVEKRGDDCGLCEHYVNFKRSEIERYTSTRKHNYKLNYNNAVEIDGILQGLDSGGSPKQALRELKQYEDITSHTYCFASGVAHALQNELDEAIYYFRAAIRIFPFFFEAWLNLSVAQMKIGHISEAYDSSQVMSMLMRGDRDYESTGRKFIAQLRQVITEMSGLPLKDYLRRERSFIKYHDLLRRGQAEPAAAGFASLLEEDDSHVQSQGNLGLCYAMLGRKAEAQKHLKKALELDPDYEPARINLKAVSKMSEGRPLSQSTDANFVGVEYYRDKVLPEQSDDLRQDKSLQAIFAACGVWPA